MFRPSVIPVLLLKDGVLVKSQNFRNFCYIGDPLNAVRIFNEQRADEMMVLDISATREKRMIPVELVQQIAELATMPFSVGGGTRELSQIKELISVGAEKVVIGSHAVVDPHFIKAAAREYGSSTIAVCIDVKRKWLGPEFVWIVNGTKRSNYSPLEFARLMENHGAGTVIIQSIEHDGRMQGYHLELIKKISDGVTIPTVALGGAGCYEDLKRAFCEGNAIGLAAGSLFVYYGKNKGVLINYPEKEEKCIYDL